MPRGAGEGRPGIEAHKGFPTHDGVVSKPAATTKGSVPDLLRQEKLHELHWVTSGLAAMLGSTGAARPTLCVTAYSTAASLGA